MNNTAKRNKSFGIVMQYTPDWRSEEDQLAIPVFVCDRRYIPMQYSYMSETTGKMYCSIVRLKKNVSYRLNSESPKGKHKHSQNYVILIGKAALSLPKKQLKALIDYKTRMFKYQTSNTRKYKELKTVNTRYNITGVNPNEDLQFNGILDIEVRKQILEDYGKAGKSLFRKMEKLNAKSQLMTGLMLRDELGKRKMYKFVNTTPEDLINYVVESVTLTVPDFEDDEVSDIVDDVEDALAKEMGDSEISFSDETNENVEFIDDASESINLDEIIDSIVE